jgi:hypothetical protein
MASLSYKKLIALRSGQTVWRVWRTVHKDADGVWRVEAYVRRTVVLGKKIHHVFERHDESAPLHISLRMECARPEPGWNDPGFEIREQRARFLTDLHGLGCYTSARAAERFKNDINSGLYPKIVEDAIEQEKEDLEFEKSMNEYESYDDYRY